MLGCEGVKLAVYILSSANSSVESGMQSVALLVI
jgi:hypothetical protein